MYFGRNNLDLQISPKRCCISSMIHTATPAPSINLLVETNSTATAVTSDVCTWSPAEEIFHFSCRLKANFSIDMSILLNYILSHMNSFQTLILYFVKIPFYAALLVLKKTVFVLEI